jgi:hypothetical protein
VSNPSKRKGDRAERAAVAYLTELTPHLVSVSKPQRKLGAGRAEDTGDLWVFHDVAVQVRSYAGRRIGEAIRTSAVDAARQAANARLPYALGMVPVPRAQRAAVRWLACVTEWPAVPAREPVRFELVGRMLAWLRDDLGPYGYDPRPRTERIATLRCMGGGLVVVAPAEAWTAAFAGVRAAVGADAASCSSTQAPGPAAVPDGSAR